jgi:hypothetical protein
MTLLTVTPGPLVNVFTDGKLVAQKQLGAIEALRLIETLSRELRVLQ